MVSTSLEFPPSHSCFLSAGCKLRNKDAAYQVDLVEVVRLHHETADDTGAVGSSESDGDFAEEDIVGCGDGLRIASGCDGELCAGVAVGDCSSVGGGELGAFALCEVHGDGFAESSVTWACLMVLASASHEGFGRSTRV